MYFVVHGTIGVAVAGVILASATTTTHAQLASATHTGWIINGAYGLAVLVLGLVGTTTHAKQTGEKVLPTTPTPTAVKAVSELVALAPSCRRDRRLLARDRSGHGHVGSVEHGA